MLGADRVTCSCVGLIALASVTTSMAALSEVVQSVLTRLIEKTASSAVKAAPLLNFALSVSSNV